MLKTVVDMLKKPVIYSAIAISVAILLTACGGDAPAPVVIAPTLPADATIVALYNSTVEYQATLVAQQEITAIAQSTQISEMQAAFAVEATQVFSNQQAVLNEQATQSSERQATLSVQRTAIREAQATLRWQTTEVAQLQANIDTVSSQSTLISDQELLITEQRLELTEINEERTQAYIGLGILASLLVVSLVTSGFVYHRKNVLIRQLKTHNQHLILEQSNPFRAIPSETPIFLEPHPISLSTPKVEFVDVVTPLPHESNTIEPPLIARVEHNGKEVSVSVDEQSEIPLTLGEPVQQPEAILSTPVDVVTPLPHESNTVEPPPIVTVEHNGEEVSVSVDEQSEIPLTLGEPVQQPEAIPSDDDWNNFVAKAPAFYIQVLKAVLDNQTSKQVIAQIARQQNKMPQVLLDEINELALDTLGQNILDLDESVAIVDEFREAIVMR